MRPITGAVFGLEDVLTELRGLVHGRPAQQGAPGALECVQAGGLIWERAT